MALLAIPAHQIGIGKLEKPFRVLQPQVLPLYYDHASEKDDRIGPEAGDEYERTEHPEKSPVEDRTGITAFVVRDPDSEWTPDRNQYRISDKIENGKQEHS